MTEQLKTKYYQGLEMKLVNNNNLLKLILKKDNKILIFNRKSHLLQKKIRT